MKLLASALFFICTTCVAFSPQNALPLVSEFGSYTTFIKIYKTITHTEYTRLYDNGGYEVPASISPEDLPRILAVHAHNNLHGVPLSHEALSRLAVIIKLRANKLLLQDLGVYNTLFSPEIEPILALLEKKCGTTDLERRIVSYLKKQAKKHLGC